jgi:hypothetical protein
VTVLTQAGLLNRIHLPANTAELVVLANNLGTAVSELAPIGGFTRVLLTVTPGDAYGIAFFQTGAAAAAAAAQVSAWWKLHLPSHGSKVDDATVLGAGVNPDARMVWAPAPVLAVRPPGALLGGLPLPHDPGDGHVGTGELDVEKVDGAGSRR